MKGARSRSTSATVIDVQYRKLKYWSVPLEDVKDCQECIRKGRKPYPISPAVKFCRRCKLDDE